MMHASREGSIFWSEYSNIVYSLQLCIAPHCPPVEDDDGSRRMTCCCLFASHVLKPWPHVVDSVGVDVVPVVYLLLCV